MTQEHYTGVHGVVLYAGSPVAGAEFGFTINRAVTTHERSGKWSDLSVPGKISCSGTLKRIQSNADWLMALMAETPSTGAAETLKSGVAVSADGYTAMDDDTIASASRVRVTVATSAITTAGTITLIGEDAAGNYREETLAVSTLDVGEYVTTTRTFLKVYGVTVIGIRSTGSGTLTVASIVGDSSVTIGAPKIYSLVGKVEDGSNHITVSLTNVFFTKGGITFTDSTAILSDDTTFTVKDPDADIIVTGVDA